MPYSSVSALENSIKNATILTFLHPKETLVVTFSENRALISRKYIPEQGMNELLEKQNFFLEAILRFYFRIIALKIQVFDVFLPLKERLVPIFSEMRALTPRKILNNEVINVSKYLGKYKLLWSYSSVFGLE